MKNIPETRLFNSWSHDPSKFDREALGIEPTNQQEEANQELCKLVWAKIYQNRGFNFLDDQEYYAKKRGISIMSGKGPGKTLWLATKILWFLTCFPNPLVPCTATTGHQLSDVLWRTLGEVLRGDLSRKSAIRDLFEWQSTKVYLKEKKGESHYAIARTANPKATVDEQVETLSGFHADYMMVGADEGSGIPDPVFRPLEGTLTGLCNFILMIFNPTRATGFAIDSHTRYRDEWICLRWNTEETISKDETWNRALQASIEAKARKFGRDSNQYRIEVLGLPPVSGTDTLIPYEWAIDAVDREVIALPTDVEIHGADIGGGGDPSVCLRRQGPKIFPIEQTDIADSEGLIGWFGRRIITYEPEYFFLDVIGIGWALEAEFRKRYRNCNILGVNVSELPAEDTRFYRLRDELAWRVREDFERRIISIPDDPILIGELTSIKFDDQRTDGKIKVESKKEMKRRGVDSPNRFDALALTEYHQPNDLRRMVGKKRAVQRQTGVSWRTV